jgi:hypothetical protein
VVSAGLAQLRFDLPEGLVAVPRQRRTGDGSATSGRDRRGRAKLDEVEIVAREPVIDKVELDEGELRFVLGANRRSWKVIHQRYGAAALQRAHALATAGVVCLRCRVDDDLRLALPSSWQLTDAWRARREQALATRNEERHYWQERQTAAATAVAPVCAELAEALRRSLPLNPTLPVLVYAAEDLAADFVNDGPRAFSQRHFGHTKERDDVAHILREAGVTVDVLKRLGVQRSGRIGVAGPIIVSAKGTSYSARAFDGPQLLRTDQPGLTLSLEQPGELVLIENLQAAETVADRHPELAVVYGAGYTGPRALALIEHLAGRATQVLLIPDADADGVAIATRWLSVAPKATIVDIGEIEHEATMPLPAWSRRKLADHAEGPAGSFAQAILERGYPLEEEMLVIRALQRALSTGGNRPFTSVTTAPSPNGTS